MFTDVRRPRATARVASRLRGAATRAHGRAMLTLVTVLTTAAIGLLPGEAVAEVRDGHYHQGLAYRLTGASLAWPSDAARADAASKGLFLPTNVIATRFQGWRDKMFVTTPKLRPGVPFSLGRFDLLQRCFPCLTPYPGWGSELVINAVDLVLDARDLLWVLDTGIVDTLTTSERRGPPKVVAFDLLTGKVVHSIDLSPLTRRASRLQHLLVHYSRQTNTPWLLVADAAANAVIVHDVAKGRGHRALLPKVADAVGPRAVLYLALVTRTDRPDRVYFTYLSSKRLFSIKASDLKFPACNGTVVDEGRKPTTMVLLGSAQTNLFFRYRGKTEVLMWNVDHAFKEANLVTLMDGDGEGEGGRYAMQVAQGFGGMLWTLETNFQDYVRNRTGCLGASMVFHPLVRPG